MTEPPNKGKGKGAAFLLSLLSQKADDCVIWPMFRDANGYGRVGFNGGSPQWAHRLMCELAHGPQPVGHEAAHSCGNGKAGCVNPRHLSWKTKTNNQLDRREHGTKARGYWGEQRKLSAEKVAKIRAMKGQKTQRQIASEFGVTDATIRDIYSGKSWNNA